MKQINIFQIIWGILTRKEIYCFIVRYVVQDGMLDNTFHHQYVTHNKKYLDWDNIAKVFSKIAEAHKIIQLKLLVLITWDILTKKTGGTEMQREIIKPLTPKQALEQLLEL